MSFRQYRQVKAQEEQERHAEPVPKQPKEKQPAERSRGNRNQQMARRQLTICERDIAKAEEQLADLDRQMEAAACDYEKLNELMKEKETVQSELEALYGRWETLSEEAEA
jgi:chromosome segregation ATPase